ncbi:hypothetical protein [Armatimonas sp.]|uniref:hypothetical protein n=1 Tax=Armatimonas sp. TaxID=1872638 RepID=UPI00375254B8
MKDFAKSLLSILVLLTALINAIFLYQKYIKAPSKTDPGAVRGYTPSTMPTLYELQNKKEQSVGTFHSLDTHLANKPKGSYNLADPFSESSMETHIENVEKKEIGGKGLVGKGRFKSDVTVQEKATGDYANLIRSRPK